MFQLIMLKLFIVLTLLGGCSSSTGGLSIFRPKWVIDTRTKFHFAHYPYKEPTKGVIVPSIDFANRDQPDITNIVLRDLYKLGFPVPFMPNSHEQTFYLKFFQYPKQFDHKISYKRFKDRFALGPLAQYADLQQLDEFLKDKKNIYIKLGHIAPMNTGFFGDNRYPVLKISEHQTQHDFDSRNIFASLYVLSEEWEKTNLLKSADEFVSKSQDGLKFFFEDLMKTYTDNLITLDTNNKEIVFLNNVECLTSTSDCQVSVIKTEKNISLFNHNYRQYPMPQDPKQVFLSGLWAIHSELYKIPKSMASINTLTWDMVVSSGEKLSKIILEVGSVVNFSDKELLK